MKKTKITFIRYIKDFTVRLMQNFHKCFYSRLRMGNFAKSKNEN